MDFITAPLIVGIVFFGLYKIIELYVRRKERMMWIQLLIQKFDGNIPEEDAKRLANAPFDGMKVSRYTGLRWGCLLAGLGLGLVLAFTISHCMNYYGTTHLYGWDFSEFYGPIYGACTLLFAGLGLVISYAIEWKQMKK